MSFAPECVQKREAKIISGNGRRAGSRQAAGANNHRRRAFFSAARMRKKQRRVMSGGQPARPRQMSRPGWEWSTLAKRRKALNFFRKTSYRERNIIRWGTRSRACHSSYSWRWCSRRKCSLNCNWHESKSSYSG